MFIHKKYIITILICLCKLCSFGQTFNITGKVFSNNIGLEAASIKLNHMNTGVVSDSNGHFILKNIAAGKYDLKISMLGYKSKSVNIVVTEKQQKQLLIELELMQNKMDEVVITGTMKEVSRIESPVPVEVYSPAYFKKNPTSSIFEALQNVNGVRPQLNCNICNTGDIHINGLEGPYTMVMIDGMPIVSSLSTVYGLSGIPNSLVERIEIVKGPASSLYGSEAVGGLINIITKKNGNAALFSADIFSTSWNEFNADLGFKLHAGKKASAITGINYFRFGNIVDNNKDHFTDIALQDRISLFQKWSFIRKDSRLFSFAFRYFYEDRWGGETNWNTTFRGGDSVYGESIYTKRFELLSSYQLPVREKLFLSMSYNNHDQDSRYGTTSYLAKQKIAFTQLTWDKSLKKHDLLAGIALRYTNYDDNTAATASIDSFGIKNVPDQIWLPGAFMQDEIALSGQHKMLFGFRYDFNSVHGNIFTPRFAYKWNINEKNIIRFNAGTGFRVVNLFTEDHAALTGGRNVEIKNKLNPEKSYNANLNYIKKIYFVDGTFIGLEFTSWYTFFNNRIIADYETDPNKIIYDNLDGYAESKGISTNIDMVFRNGLKIIAGATYMDVSTIEKGIRQQQILTEKFTGTWAISYKIKKINLGIDYTGNIYSPMRLPLLSKEDPRLPFSPTWSLQNIQFVFSGFKKMEIYAGIKNLLNWTPNKNNPFIIARTNDPFDKRVEYDSNGKVLATTDNPYALTFDPSYVFAPNQGIRGFFGFRIHIR